jgi:lysozyme family protein
MRLDTDSWKQKSVESVIVKIEANLERYIRAMTERGLEHYEWVFSGIHYRENDKSFPNWRASMLNGQDISKKSTIVPKGEGPFKSWEESLDRALYYRPFKAKNVAEALEYCERYNGIGNRYHGQESTYVLGFTNYSNEKGKYIGDGTYSSSKMDSRPGIAALYLFQRENKRGFFSVEADEIRKKLHQELSAEVQHEQKNRTEVI